MAAEFDPVGWCTRCADGSDRFITTAEVSWELGRKGSGLVLIVPAGFVFDVSIPRMLHWLWSPVDRRYLKAACLHDYAVHVLRWDRVTSAAPFAACLLSNNVNTAQALLFTLAVIVWKWRSTQIQKMD